jgi:hypothetical protein
MPNELTSIIEITGEENSGGELTGVSATKTVKVGETPIVTARSYYPGAGGSNNIPTNAPAPRVVLFSTLTVCTQN